MMPVRLYRTTTGAFVEGDGGFHALPDEWDALVNRDDLAGYLDRQCITENRAPQLEGNPIRASVPSPSGGVASSAS